MRILHYSLGFPPYRSGGMTTFCVDLMAQQKKDGHEVALLWPGTMLGNRISILERRSVNEIGSYELINPLPVPYDEGIVEIEKFTQYGERGPFLHFLKTLEPDVIHIHTFMGLYPALLGTAKELGIRTVYTSHDFFPICPKVTMYRQGKNCDSADSCTQCPECNVTALSLRKIKMLQSPVYREMKDLEIMKKLRKHHRDKFFYESSPEPVTASRTQEDYIRLRKYYEGMLDKIDVIHYNSSIAKKIHEEYFGVKDSIVIPITHAAIRDSRRRKIYESDKPLRIRYLGQQRGGKGYFLLTEALDKLWTERQNFCLDIHFVPIVMKPYMRCHERYDYAQLEDIFYKTDVLVCPSVWNETFGYVVLEALSYGVPVIISGTVGAKDIMTLGSGVVIEDITGGKLLMAFKQLTPEKLRTMNERIIESQKIMALSDMASRIYTDCYMENEV